MPKTQLIIILITICLVDIIIPIPILGLLLLHVVFTRPSWFRALIDGIYNA
jgi:hypothetical protein